MRLRHRKWRNNSRSENEHLRVKHETLSHHFSSELFPAAISDFVHSHDWTLRWIYQNIGMEWTLWFGFCPGGRYNTLVCLWPQSGLVLGYKLSKGDRFYDVIWIVNKIEHSLLYTCNILNDSDKVRLYSVRVWMRQSFFNKKNEILFCYSMKF